jgi:hypothetical protein
MSLSNITPLPAIVPVRDPAWFEVTCNGLLIAAAEHAAYALVFLQSPTPGLAFTILIGNMEVPFTFINGPSDDSGTEVTIGSSFAEHQANLITALRANYHIDQLFTVSDQGSHVRLDARSPGYMQVMFSNTVPVSLSFNELATGSDGVFAPNYSANVQIWVEHDWMSEVFTPMPSLQNVPDAFFNTRWDLSSFLRTTVSHDWPAYEQSIPTAQRSLQRRFYTTRWEQFGDPPMPQAVIRSSIRRAWFAGSRNIEHNVFQQVFGLLQSTALKNPFLTYRGRKGRHEVSAHQQCYLGYYRRTAKFPGQQLKLKADVTWTDGTSNGTVVWTDSDITGFVQGDVILFPTGFHVLGLQALDPTRTPRQYSVQVIDHNAQALSESYTFHVMPQDANERHIEYVNSLGVVESLRCTAASSEAINTAHQEVHRLLTVMRTALPGEQVANDRQLLDGNTVKLKVHTGFMDRGELNALLDVLFSPEWRLVLPDRRTRAPLLLIDAEHIFRRQGEPDENLHALQLEFRIGDTEMAWSDRASMPKLPLVPDLPTE